MRCPYCGNGDPGTKVVDSREQDEAIRRRRECLTCGQRFTTYERAARIGFSVVKKDGRREDFSREKLLGGMRLACFKRPIAVEEINRAAEEIEAELFSLGRVEVPTQLIGERVMTALRELDEVAYVRFASVYRAFRDVDTIVEEIEGLRQWKRQLVEARNQLRFRFDEDQPLWS